MSDYLWDKTGEVDEEAERLEELLSQFRFQPRTFEVPAALPIVPRRAPRRTDTYSWARLAVAASVLVALLAGTWLVLKRQPAGGAIVQVAQDGSRDAVPAQQRPQPARDQSASVPPMAPAAGNRDRSASRRPRRAAFSNAGLKRPAAPRRQSNEGATAPRQELAEALTPREREAMEKFLLAMKVTSEKLNYAQQQVAGLNEK